MEIFYKMNKDREEMWMMIRMGLILATVLALVWTTMTLVKNKDIIMKDPIVFGMDAHGFISCQCYDQKGVEWYTVGNGFVNQQQAGQIGEWNGSG